MTRRGAAAAVAFIALRWPYPDITADENAAAALAADLAAYDDDEVIAALERLVTEGERYQPRGPIIINAINRMRREQAAMREAMAIEERMRARRLEKATCAPPPPDVADVIARIKARR